MTPSPHPELDLTVSRIIKAPRSAVWHAWTDPASFEQWWVPAPAVCRVRDMDLRPGGSFRTEISDDGAEFGPHVTGCFLAVDELERIVFTDALVADWRPAETSFVTAVIAMADHPDGTEYSATRCTAMSPTATSTSSLASTTAGAPSRSSSPSSSSHSHRQLDKEKTMQLIVLEFVSLDGVSQGPGSPEEDTSDGFTQGGWLVPHVDEAFIRQAAEWLGRADALLLGRRTYEALVVAPVIVGHGRRLFPEGGAPAGLRPLNSESTPGGLAIQTYEWAGPPDYATYSGVSNVS